MIPHTPFKIELHSTMMYIMNYSETLSVKCMEDSPRPMRCIHHHRTTRKPMLRALPVITLQSCGEKKEEKNNNGARGKKEGGQMRCD